MTKNYQQIAQHWGLEFKNIDLFKEALTHRSYLNENKNWPLSNNERLEFLGDAVLNITTADFLFKHYPDFQEGDLTKLRAALVDTKSLLRVAQELGLNHYLLVSKGEEEDLKSKHPRIVANAIEALIGALYLDGGITKAQQFIEKHIFKNLDNIIASGSYKDSKSIFQERTQRMFRTTPVYRIEKEWGPDHARKFLVGVYLQNKKVAEGEGSSKQKAEVEAAKSALQKYQGEK